MNKLCAHSLENPGKLGTKEKTSTGLIATKEIKRRLTLPTPPSPQVWASFKRKFDHGIDGFCLLQSFLVQGASDNPAVEKNSEREGPF